MKIFNRWGVKVYDIDGYGTAGKFFRGLSDGRITTGKGEELPSGTYYYVLTYIKQNGDLVEKSGPFYINNK